MRKDDDLFELSGDRGVYKGWCVEDIHAAQDGALGYVEFGNGHTAWEGASGGSAGDQHQRLMIRQAVESHFEKELQLKLQERRRTIAAPLKPLTLFFIDRVANYHPADGKFRTWFEEEYASVKAHPKFRVLTMPDVDVVHDGYFATTNKGVPKDTKFGQDTKDTESAFERIMQNKEELLSFDEPLRFIFSHSALVEGWDNPNVFTICNLQDGRSEMRKRQQIGRGLRLPVMSDGERCLVDDVNMLTVIANEDFSKFAGDLQKEIEDETGVSFEGRIVRPQEGQDRASTQGEGAARPAVHRAVGQDRRGRRPTSCDLDTDDVVADAVRRINAMPAIEPIKFRVTKHVADINTEGITSGDTQDRGPSRSTGSENSPTSSANSPAVCRSLAQPSSASCPEIDNLDQTPPSSSTRSARRSVKRSTNRRPTASSTPPQVSTGRRTACTRARSGPTTTSHSSSSCPPGSSSPLRSATTTRTGQSCKTTPSWSATRGRGTPRRSPLPRTRCGLRRPQRRSGVLLPEPPVDDLVFILGRPLVVRLRRARWEFDRTPDQRNWQLLHPLLVHSLLHALDVGGGAALCGHGLSSQLRPE